MTERVEALCKRLRLAVFHLHGGVPVRRRPALLDAFTRQEGSAVFVSTDAGGLGLNLQTADVVINLDLPWSPARLEQRIARVHRIGSKSAVQELLLITKDSIEERILHLHETKRNLLMNIWDQGGEDVIAAPGGSGAFQDMIAALLRTRGPEAPPPAVAVEDVSATIPTAPGSPSGDSAARVEPALGAAMEAVAPPVSEEVAVTEDQTAPCLVDPALVSAAITAIAPMLPPEHRRSLATIFRALADSLELP